MPSLLQKIFVVSRKGENTNSFVQCHVGDLCTNTEKSGYRAVCFVRAMIMEGMLPYGMKGLESSSKVLDGHQRWFIVQDVSLFG